MVQGELLSKQLHLALRRVQSHHAVRQADFALPGQTADAQNFALEHVQIRALHGFAGHIDHEIADFHGDLPLLGRRAAFDRVRRFAASADHQRRQLLGGGLPLFARGDQLAVAQDGDAVGRVHHLAQPVSDKDNSDAARRDVLHHVNQLLGLTLGEHGGRLVEHQQLHALLVDFARDLDKLHIADRQAAHRRSLTQLIHAHGIQRRARVFIHTGVIENFQLAAQQPADGPRAGDFPVQLDIFGNGKARNQHEFLMHHADALIHGVHRRQNPFADAVHEHFTLKAAGRMNDRHAEEDVHQRGLPRAVLAEQRVNLAGTNLQRHVFQHRVLAVCLGNIVHFKNVSAGQGVSLQTVQNTSMGRTRPECRRILPFANR